MQTLTSDGSVLEIAVEDVIDVVQVDEVPQPVVLTPRAYLYAMYPLLAPRLNCVINRESRWDPSAVNPRSGAGGLTQMLLSTWLTTPPGKRGESRFNAY